MHGREIPPYFRICSEGKRSFGPVAQIAWVQFTALYESSTNREQLHVNLMLVYSFVAVYIYNLVHDLFTCVNKKYIYHLLSDIM
jgi:hypothetical protein